VQQRHSPRSTEQSPFDARRRHSWLQHLAAVAGTSALTLFSVGCPEPADLDNPEMYPKRGGTAGSTASGGTASGGTASGGTASGGTASSGTASSGTASGGTASFAACETGCMTQVLDGCTLCHGDALKSAMLDLKTAGYSARLKDQPATHAEAQGPCPSGDKLIDSGNPAESWLLKKVAGAQGTCGTEMPPSAALTGTDLKCVQDYVSCVATGGM
jgi:hypothetical protein